jgi:hypothetical protein
MSLDEQINMIACASQDEGCRKQGADAKRGNVGWRSNSATISKFEEWSQNVTHKITKTMVLVTNAFRHALGTQASDLPP